MRGAMRSRDRVERYVVAPSCVRPVAQALLPVFFSPSAAKPLLVVLPVLARASFACIALASVLLAACPCAHALDPALDVSQYAHTAWRVRDGFVTGAIGAIAQAPDGYLWLGTEFGLYRFDGVRAVPWQPPAGQQLPNSQIQRLMVSRDGTLWIGTMKGLASWGGGQLTRYPEIADRAIAALLEDREGTIWVGEWSGLPGGRLCAIRKGAVECYGTDGSLGWGALTMFEDSKGNLWVGGGVPPKFGFWHWKPGAPKFYSPGVGRSLVNCFAEDTDGGLLVGTSQGVMRLLDDKVKALPDALPRSMRGLTARSLRRDRDGGLWFGVFGGGLAHIHRGRTDVFTQSDGLSGNSVTAFFEDREGNIWVATDDGLDRFRNFAIPAWSARQGLAFSIGAAVLAGNDRAIWAGSLNSLRKLYEGEVTIYHQRTGTGAPPASPHVHEKVDRRLPQKFYSLFQDHNGRLWFSSPEGLGYLDREQFHPIPPFGTRVIYSLAEDPTGDLWVEDLENGLFRMRDERVTLHIRWDTIGHNDNGISLAVDHFHGGLCLGFSGGGVVYLKDGQVRASYSVSDGLGQGGVTDLRFGSRGTLWAATEGGLSRIREGHITTLASKDGLPCDKVHWSIEDDDHFVWLYMPCGLVRIARSDLDAWVSDPEHKVQPDVFDNSEGVRTVAYFGGFHPQASKAPDGRIWFGTMDGVGMIDPRHLPYNRLAPPVHIEQISADRKTYNAVFDVNDNAEEHLRLPPLIRDLQIDYTALSLVAPEKVRFRYKLEGWDRDWQDAGTRRQAFYSNLPPRNYRFRVTACNNSGVWNEAGTFLDFAVAPAYYQTIWFRSLSVAAFFALLWGLYHLRLRQLAQQFNMRMEARVSERTRIARELHDTLLQSFQGLLLRFQATTYLLPGRPEEARATLESAIDQAAKAITEGRDAVQGLRSSAFVTNDLACAITTLGQELASGETNANEAGFHVEVEGTPRDLHPILRDEVYRIAGEALRNAFKHAQAQRIEVEIHYDERQLRLRVRDDGKGIDAKHLNEDGRPGHFGLRGMRERAKLMGGKLTVWSELDSGTEVELRVPASRVYETSPARRRSWLAEKFSGKETETKP